MHFLWRNPDELWVGSVPLRSYLEQCGLGQVVRLKELVDRIDTSALEQVYTPAGRPPYHPKVILGLMLYGLTQGKTSLRELERLALCDVGAWWICGGLQPDHATVGRTLLRHEHQLTESFFVEVTQQIVRELNLNPNDIAGDGTVIEAAASHYKTMKRQALEQHAEALREQAEQTHDAHQTEQRAKLAQQALQALDERQQHRKSKGRDPNTVRVAPDEPDAVVQKQKDGTTRPAYKPSVMADETRLILGVYVDPSSELEAVEPMVEQCTKILERPLPTTLLDAGYCNEQVLSLSIERDIDLLCPSGRLDTTGNAVKASRQGKLAKTAFTYDAEKDIYRCPQGQTLARRNATQDRHGASVVVYQAQPSACANCPVRARCTDGPKGRSIYRYPGDELKEAMQQVMAQPQARHRYAKRKAMVEPIFAQLHSQGLRRFRRRGLKKARLEFVLHCLAYNLHRAAQLQLIAAHARFPDGSWGLLAVWARIIPR